MACARPLRGDVSWMAPMTETRKFGRWGAVSLATELLRVPRACSLRVPAQGSRVGPRAGGSSGKAWMLARGRKALGGGQRGVNQVHGKQPSRVGTLPAGHAGQATLAKEDNMPLPAVRTPFLNMLRIFLRPAVGQRGVNMVNGKAPSYSGTPIQMICGAATVVHRFVLHVAALAVMLTLALILPLRHSHAASSPPNPLSSSASLSPASPSKPEAQGPFSVHTDVSSSPEVYHSPETSVLSSTEIEWRADAAPAKITVPLRVMAAQGTVPAIWKKEFLASQSKRAKLHLDTRATLDSLFTDLAALLGPRSPTANAPKMPKSPAVATADAVSLGDRWLGEAVKNRLVVPIPDAEAARWYTTLPKELQRIVKRNEKGDVDEVCGEVYGAPFRVGCYMIAWRMDKLDKGGIAHLTSWADLWRPQLKGRIGMAAGPREAVCISQRSLGIPFNVPSLTAISACPGGTEVAEAFVQLKKQVRTFDSRDYLKALQMGDVWVAVGWSSDILPFARRNNNIAVCIPLEGTFFFSDLWTLPNTAALPSRKPLARTRGPSPLVHQWLAFCAQPARERGLLRDSFTAFSPSSLNDGSLTIPAELRGTLKRLEKQGHLNGVPEACQEEAGGVLSQMWRPLQCVARKLWGPLWGMPQSVIGRIKGLLWELGRWLPARAGGIRQAASSNEVFPARVRQVGKGLQEMVDCEGSRTMGPPFTGRKTPFVLESCEPPQGAHRAVGAQEASLGAWEDASDAGPLACPWHTSKIEFLEPMSEQLKADYEWILSKEDEPQQNLRARTATTIISHTMASP